MNFINPFLNLFILAGLLGITIHFRHEYMKRLQDDTFFFTTLAGTTTVISFFLNNPLRSFHFWVASMVLVIFLPILLDIITSKMARVFFRNETK